MIRVAQRRGQPAALRDGPAGAVRRAEVRSRTAARSCSAIYHSHTKSAAYPSQTDVNQAVAWPEPDLRDRLAGRRRGPGREGLPAQGPEDRRCRARRRISDSRRRRAPTAVAAARTTAGDEGGGGGGGGGDRLVKVAFARNQAEAEMIQGLLSRARHPEHAEAQPRLRRPRVPRRRPATSRPPTRQKARGARRDDARERGEERRARGKRARPRAKLALASRSG